VSHKFIIILGDCGITKFQNPVKYGICLLTAMMLSSSNFIGYSIFSRRAMSFNHKNCQLFLFPSLSSFFPFVRKVGIPVTGRGDP
jgi:hypothetical protein